MKDKIQLIFIPFLLIIFGLTAFYTFLHWLLFIKFEIFSLKEFITNFVIPIVLAGLVVLIFLRPRLKILDTNSKKGDSSEAILFGLCIILSVPIIISQFYIGPATGELTRLDTINEINQKKQTKYYSLNKYYIDKDSISVHPSFDVSGRYNDEFNMHIYVTLPILGDKKETGNEYCLAWLGLEYREQLSNRLENYEKDQKYKQFAEKSQQDLIKRDFSKFVYLERLGNSDKRDGLIHAIKKNPQYNSKTLNILIPVNEPFEARNGDKLAWLIGSMIAGSLILLLILLITKLNEKQLNRFKKGKPDKESKIELEAFLFILKPRNGYFITPILIWVNIGIYLIMVIAGLGFLSFKGQDLLLWGANYGPAIKSGEWWRLFTCIFLHGGLMHVLANMYGLLFIGIILEPILGKTKYLIVYVLTGIIASCASIWWHDATISVGASGAIFGLYGLFLVLLVTKIFPKHFEKTFLVSTLIFVGYNLLIGLLGSIDNSAHIGGLLSGFILGIVLYPTLKKTVATNKSVPSINREAQS